MTKTYILPQLSAIKIDREVSLRLTTLIENEEKVLEPGSGGAGLGGEGNGSGESGWERTGLGSPEPKDPFGTSIWE